MQAPTVTREELANCDWRPRKRQKMLWDAAPPDWPAALNDVLKPGKSWPSPAVPGQMESYIAWTWLTQEGRAGHREQGAARSWWSRLAVKHALLSYCSPDGSLSLTYVCLFVGKWGCLALKVLTERGALEIARTQGSIQVLHITNPDGWTVALCGGVFEHDIGLVLARDGDEQGLLQHALLTRRDFTTWELDLAIGDMLEKGGVEAADGATASKLEKCVRLAFPGDDARITEVLALYAKESGDAEEDLDEENDPEFLELLEEMAVSDQVNTSDLKTWKETADKKSRPKYISKEMSIAA